MEQLMWEPPMLTATGNNTGNNSNVFRIYAAIKQGTFSDHDGRLIQQVCEDLFLSYGRLKTYFLTLTTRLFSCH